MAALLALVWPATLWTPMAKSISDQRTKTSIRESVINAKVDPMFPVIIGVAPGS